MNSAAQFIVSYETFRQFSKYRLFKLYFSLTFRMHVMYDHVPPTFVSKYESPIKNKVHPFAMYNCQACRSPLRLDHMHKNASQVYPSPIGLYYIVLYLEQPFEGCVSTRYLTQSVIVSLISLTCKTDYKLSKFNLQNKFGKSKL